MSNEIGRKLNNYNITKPQMKDDVSQHFSENECSINDSAKMQETMEFLGTMGLSQVVKVKPTQTTIDAVDEVKHNYDYVQHHISFCNQLVEKGYSLPEADKITQNVFNNLKNKNTYI